MGALTERENLQEEDSQVTDRHQRAVKNAERQQAPLQTLTTAHTRSKTFPSDNASTPPLCMFCNLLSPEGEKKKRHLSGQRFCPEMEPIRAHALILRDH